MDVRALVVCAVLLLVAARSGAQMQAVGDGGPGPVKAQHLTAELTSVGPAIAPGGRLEVGLVLTLEEGWHVFWKNPGDSGEPPKIVWTLPKGVTAGPMRFPIPKRLPQGELMNFGYEDSVGFPVEIAAAKNVAPGPIHLDAKVDWLVCREVCVPGKAHLGIDLEVMPNVPAPSGRPVGALGEALALLPDPLPKGMKLTVKGGKTEFVFTLVTGERETDGEFYPLDPDQIANAEDQVTEPMANGLRLRVERAADPKHPDRPGPLPKEIRGLIKLSDEQVYAVTAPVVAGEALAEARPGKAGSAASKRTAIGAMAAVVLGLAAFATVLYAPKDRTLVWQPYTRAALDEARAAGQPVFVDFTAAWCLSCQVNERMVLRSAEVQREFSAHGVVLMEADWTKYDAAITQELASVGRSGVPTYVLYPAGAGSAAEVLPEWLTREVVLGALRSDLERE